MSKWYVKQHDAGTRIRAQLVDDQGAQVNLSTATGLKFHMRKARMPKGTPAKVDSDAEIVQALNGIVEYAFADGDTDTPDHYEAEWEVTFPDGMLTFPNNGYDMIVVVPQIA